MEFWGVEVKSGESLKVDPGDDKIVHLSMACLGEVSKDKGSEPVSLYVKIDNQKLAVGTLSLEKFPQISYDLIFEKEFELSHNWKNGSVFFTGYKAESQLASDDDDDDDEDSDDFIAEDIPAIAANGKPEPEVKKIANPKKNEKDNKKDTKGEDDNEDSSEADSDEDSSEDEPMANGQIDISEDDDDDDDSDDEETPKKTEGSNKRLPESSKKTPAPVKKAKFVTPEKTGGKSSVHVATPYPFKQAGKAAANDKQQVTQQTPKSGGDYSCKPCNRSFKTEDALGSHNKAKHSAK